MVVRKGKIDWQRKGEKELRSILALVSASPALRKSGGGAIPLKADLKIVGSSAMTRLNSKWRGKKRPTDVLSFPAPEIFRQMGHLGELIVCEPVMKRQALEQDHALGMELRILLVHGVLHLLGFDHEAGPREARAMAGWEAKLLEGPGLIHRSR